MRGFWGEGSAIHSPACAVFVVVVVVVVVVWLFFFVFCFFGGVPKRRSARAHQFHFF